MTVDRSGAPNSGKSSGITVRRVVDHLRSAARTGAAAMPAVKHGLRQAEQGLGLLGWSDGADRLRRRLALLHHRLGDPWPDVADAALLDRIDEWLAPELGALAAGARVDLTAPLRRLLPWPEAARLDELAPERLTVASGSRARIDYPAADDPAGRPDRPRGDDAGGVRDARDAGDGRGGDRAGRTDRGRVLGDRARYQQRGRHRPHHGCGH